MQTESTSKDPTTAPLNLSRLDLSSPAFIANPYTAYKLLHTTNKPYWFPIGTDNSKGMWMISNYDDATTILKESGRTTNNITPLLSKQYASPLENTILQSDPPEHTRRRKAITQHFTNKSLESLKPHIDNVINDQIKRCNKDGGMDFMQDFAYKVPFILAAKSIGIPTEDYDMFFNWSRQLTAGLDYMTCDEDIQVERGIALQAMKDYFSAWLQDTHEHPRNTITYDLLKLYRNTNNLDRTELLSMLVLLLIASHENITSTLGNGMLRLLQHPDQKSLLVQQPELMSSAIEEILRYDSPVQRASLRIVTDKFTVSDHVYNQGDMLSVMLGAANRDPAQFNDPDRFDIRRKPNKHLSFGSGIHACVGAKLGRMQAQLVFTRVFEKWPNIRLAEKSHQWRQSTLFRSLLSLPVQF